MTGLTSPLPHSVAICGRAYEINTDYRIMLRFETAMLELSPTDNSGFLRIISNILPDFIPSLQITSENSSEVIQRLTWFYACGHSYDKSGPTTDGKKGRRYYDFTEDASYIYAAFMQQYGIDLSKGTLHWWQFRALFAGLTDTTEMVKIMQYRGTDLSKIKYKPERERLKKLQQTFALKDSKRQRYASVGARDEARLEYMRKRFAEVQEKRGD